MSLSTRCRRWSFLSQLNCEFDLDSHLESRIRSRQQGDSGDSKTDVFVSKRKSKRKITKEDIAEYLAKKAYKKDMKVAKKLKSQTISGYSDDSNPFGDTNLNEKFVWKKKIERDITQGVSLDEFSIKAVKKRQRERMAEIEKVKKRREERATEKAHHEEEMALLARVRAQAEFQDWEKKEEEFHFAQSKIRSEIRRREGRSKPIDILTKNLDPSDDFEIALNEPYMVFKGLTVKGIEELHDDIKMHLDLDRATPTHTLYWEALMVVCEWELAEASKRDALGRGRMRGEQLSPGITRDERGVHLSIEMDVMNLLGERTCGELEALQSQIESQMRSGTAKVIEYWEAILRRLQIYKAKACLKEIHAKMLGKHLEQLKTPSKLRNKETKRISRLEGWDSDRDVADAEILSSTTIVEAEVLEEAAEGSYSPYLLHADENEDAIDPEEDTAILEKRRTAALEDRRIQELASRPSPDDNFENNAMRAMGATREGDAVFGSSIEIDVDSQVYWWHDKYHPRKPKYFNRVHTGYDWNRYNRTHYEHDNPPPKIVQGYKFNISYPDLVEKSKDPTYKIDKDGDSCETCIIRFHAGPPYEDLAFRIINEEWEYSHKKGFKCTFERGILHLYFKFKRYCYHQ